MNEALYIQGVRDSIVSGSGTFSKVDNFAEVAMELGYSYPFSHSEVTLDSVSGENNKDIWLQLNKYAKVLAKKLPDGIEAEAPKFVMHHNFKVNGTAGKAGVSYMPFTVTLSDGQMLTALVRNSEVAKSYQAKKPTVVMKWALNAQDITREVYKNGDDSIDMATTVARLAKIIGLVHTRFVLKNPVAPKANLVKEIDEMKLDLGDVVWEAKDDKEAKIKAAVKKGLKTSNLEEAQQILDDILEAYDTGSDPMDKGVSWVEKLTEPLEKHIIMLETEPEDDSEKDTDIKSILEEQLQKRGEPLKVGEIVGYADQANNTSDNPRKVTKVSDDGFVTVNQDGEEEEFKFSELQRGWQLAPRDTFEDFAEPISTKEAVSKAKELAQAEVESGEYRAFALNDEAMKLIKGKSVDGGDGTIIMQAYTSVLDEGRERLAGNKNTIKTLSKDDETIKSIEIDYSESTEKVLKKGTMFDNLSDLHTAIAEEWDDDYQGNKNTRAEGLYDKLKFKINFKNGESVDVKMYVGGENDFNPFTDTLNNYLSKNFKTEMSKGEAASSTPAQPAKPTDAELIAKITEDEVYKQIMKDSHDGVMYNVDNKYDATHLLELWEQVQHKESQNGIIKGAMNFLQDEGNIPKEDKPNKSVDYNFSKFDKITTSEEFENELDALAEQIETDGKMDDNEDKLNELADKLTEMMKAENE